MKYRSDPKMAQALDVLLDTLAHESGGGGNTL